MLPQQWDIYKRAARLETLDKIPMAMIIDSPWIPGYLGISHLDYFLVSCPKDLVMYTDAVKVVGAPFAVADLTTLVETALGTAVPAPV